MECCIITQTAESPMVSGALLVLESGKVNFHQATFSSDVLLTIFIVLVVWSSAYSFFLCSAFSRRNRGLKQDDLILKVLNMICFNPEIIYFFKAF